MGSNEIMISAAEGGTPPGISYEYQKQRGCEFAICKCMAGKGIGNGAKRPGEWSRKDRNGASNSHKIIAQKLRIVK